MSKNDLYLFLGIIGTSLTSHFGSKPTVKNPTSSSFASSLTCSEHTCPGQQVSSEAFNNVAIQGSQQK